MVEENNQKSVLGKGLSEVLAKQAAPVEKEEVPVEEEKDEKTQAQERLLDVEARIKKLSGQDVDMTDIEIEYLQARTTFAMMNFSGTLDYLNKLEPALNVAEEKFEAAKAEEQTPAKTPAEEPAEEPAEPAPEPTPGEDDAGPGEGGAAGTDAPSDASSGSQPGQAGEETEEEQDGEASDDEVLPEDKPLIFCMFCGEKITDDSVFCNWCGKKVK